MISKIILISAVITVAYGNCGPCPQIPKHYDELGCKGIQHTGDCCPERFECPDFLAYNNSQCHFKGKSYEIGKDLDNDVAPPCFAGCKCLSFSETATFNCANIECPEHFFPPALSNCALQHTLDSCCAVDKICDKNEMKNLHTCWLRGKHYRQGDWIYPEFDPCYQCVCDESFDNSTAMPLNKNCQKLDCGIELRNLENIRKGCIPVYYGENRCCPIEYRCPIKSDAVIPVSRSESNQDDELPESTCQYSKLVLNRGDKLNSDDKCVTCMCKTPPMVDCVKDPDCYKQKTADRK